MAYPGPCAPREDRTPHQICADDNDVVLRAPFLVHLWPPVQGSESEEGAEEGSRLWLQELLGLDRSREGDGLSHQTLHIICPLGNMSGSCTLGSLCWEDALYFQGWSLRPRMAN